MSEWRSGQFPCLSPLQPESDCVDRRWLYVIGYGGLPLGHVGSLWELRDWYFHTNDPLGLTYVPTKDNI